MSYFTGRPPYTIKSTLSGCCAGCAMGQDDQSRTNIIGIVAVVGIGYLAIKSMKKVAR